MYKHIFPNGKSYIGITRQKVENRWKKGEGYKSQPKVYNAIKKYGWDNITHVILAEELSEYKAKDLEHKLIMADDAIVNGYNQSFGNYADVSEQTSNKYFQIYNAFLGPGAFNEFLEITDKNEELLKYMVKYALKQGKADKKRNLQANIADDILRFSLLCDVYLAFRYLHINEGDEKSLKVVDEQIKEFDEDITNQILSTKKTWWFNPHKRALDLFIKS